MKATIIKIGNSQGVRIPKPLLDQCGFENEVELEVHDRELIIRSPRHPRKGWADAFQKMAETGDDDLLDAVETEWGQGEWEWE